ncbi:competence/damage-inducible protein A [Enterococcus hermanniensis]|uniref:Putative competence-damage inducible protein n=1 Tax=Enterococcus hermanniensis TaxID=249189 RepID=A0A1L8TGI0_9ENTE|nr:competence/damage-inducible protein A [Enterococcus hermanniensis]OJG43333.1 competence/damage-inducible protein CinA domain [Enterococcus hermanniensis]
MKAEIIAVGTELLLGQVVNTNATFLSEKLADMGIEVYFHTVVGDNPARLEELLQLADQRSELIILCGGLGPTDDDLTKNVLADHIGVSLVQNAAGLEALKAFFAQRQTTMTPNNLRQIETLKDGIPLPNRTGLAIGCLYKGKKNNYILLPGPPSELKPMFIEQARPLLEKEFPTTEKLTSRVLRFFGIGESKLVTDLADMIENQTNPTIAPYAKPNEVTLRITAKTEDEASAKALLDQAESEILAKVGEFFYGYGEENSLVEVVVDLLKENNLSLTAAESLTAGEFQATLGKIAGVSEVFPGGFVTYSKATKASFLGIDSGLLEREGVVSEACAKAMAESALVLAKTDFALSFTGVAGPDELEGKARGTVFIGLAQRGKTTIVTENHFSRDRSYIRHSSVMKGLDMLRRSILNKI